MRCMDCASDEESLGSEDSGEESIDPDEFEANDSDLSDGGEAEPFDGETLGSEDSERSNDSECDEDEDEEKIVYASESEDELDRLDALAEEMAQNSKRRRV